MMLLLLLLLLGGSHCGVVAARARTAARYQVAHRVVGLGHRGGPRDSMAQLRRVGGGSGERRRAGQVVVPIVTTVWVVVVVECEGRFIVHLMMLMVVGALEDACRVEASGEEIGGQLVASLVVVGALTVALRLRLRLGLCLWLWMGLAVIVVVAIGVIGVDDHAVYVLDLLEYVDLERAVIDASCSRRLHGRARSQSTSASAAAATACRRRLVVRRRLHVAVDHVGRRGGRRVARMMMIDAEHAGRCDAIVVVAVVDVGRRGRCSRRRSVEYVDKVLLDGGARRHVVALVDEFAYADGVRVVGERRRGRVALDDVLVVWRARKLSVQRNEKHTAKSENKPTDQIFLRNPFVSPK